MQSPSPLPLKTAVVGRQVPQIVSVVLKQAEKQRRAGLLTQKAFDLTLKRLCDEELSSRNLNLVVDELPEGGTCFRVESTNGQTCEVIEVPGDRPLPVRSLQPSKPTAISRRERSLSMPSGGRLLPAI